MTLTNTLLLSIALELVVVCWWLGVIAARLAGIAAAQRK